MRLRHPVRLAIAAAIAVVPCATLAAQQPAPLNEPPPLPTLQQQVAGLADGQATHTGFTFDRGMLQSAEGLLDPNQTDARRVVAALNSITVDNYHFARPAFYEPEAMSSLIANFNAAGWKHLVDAHARAGNSAQPSAPITDLWLHFRGADIDDVAVLVRGPSTMNLVEVSGDLRPLDLLHLSGHFGIPKVDPDAVMVPAPPGR